jgi:hypothetical protein
LINDLSSVNVFVSGYHFAGALWKFLTFPHNLPYFFY